MHQLSSAEAKIAKLVPEEALETFLASSERVLIFHAVFTA
jgi:phosphoribosyl-ATP pyrophosphohydrolase